MPAARPDGEAKRAAIVEVFRLHERERLGPPSVRQIGDAVGLSSTSTVFAHIQRLVRDGDLEAVPLADGARCEAREVRYRLVIPNGAPCPCCGHEATR